MTAVGANIDELRGLAKKMKDAADRLQTAKGALGTTISQTVGNTWQGSDAFSMQDVWTSQLSVTLQSAADTLSKQSGVLGKNADDQETTSNELGGAGGGAASVGTHVRNQQVTNTLSNYYAQRDRLLNASPAEVDAWWNGLTEQQRQDLKDNIPGELTRLKGSAATNKEINDAYTAYQLSNTEKSSGSVDIHIKIAAFEVLEIGGGVNGAVTEYADGHTIVSFSMDGSLGATAMGEADVKGTVTYGREYTFATRAEADAFLADMKKTALDINVREGVKLLVAPPAFVIDQGGDMADHLKKYDDKLTSTKWSGKLSAELDLKVPGDSENKLTIGAGVEVSHDTTTGDTSVEVSANGAAKSVFASGNAEAKVKVTADNNGVMRTATFEFSIAGATGPALEKTFNKFTGGIGDGSNPIKIEKIGEQSASSQRGLKATGTSTLDLTDPAQAKLMADYTKAVASNDIAGQGIAMKQIFQKSEVAITIQTTESTSIEKEYLGNGGNITVEHAQTQAAWTKPPSGGWKPVAVGLTK